ncbi:hypothetical protein D4764_12G0009940 [Takifugu flavidus]|uniref:Uncharacterized protein n=1 Tax=Takifugu flavidus TaxID=433684 RepID=A0A5C6PCS7_9TELE|nr:hypothetical protein D4764_12G0009940 [Takifugu flavidus]
MVLSGGSGELSRLMRRHGVKVGARSLYTVEEVALAVGEVIGHGSVKSAAWMNGAVVLFVEKVEQVNRLVEAGISVGGRFEAVLPLSQLATKDEVLDWNHTEPHPPSQQVLRQLVYSHGLVDVWKRGRGEFSCLKQWWDYGKTQIRMLCQQHTLNVTRPVTRSIRDLETEIVELERLNESTGNGGSVGILKTKKMALANLLGARAQGALVRSRIQNISEMDAPSSFFGLKRKSGQRKLVHSLLSDTGQELTDLGQIRSRAVEFYASLYKTDFKDDKDCLNGFSAFSQGLPRVSKETNHRMESPLTTQELHAALH